ncbi:MAG: thiamine phosphate synthase [Deferribacterales bacterium]
MKIIQVIDYQTFGEGWLDIAVMSARYADRLWFRIKNVSDDLMVKECGRLKKALPDMDIVLSGKPVIAVMCGLTGAHLNRDTYVTEIPKLIRGYSAHSIEEIESIEADYYTLSPIFMTKKDYEVKPLGVPDVSGLHREIYALGGINLSNVSQLRNMGYAGVAGIGFYKELKEIRELISSF